MENEYLKKAIEASSKESKIIAKDVLDKIDAMETKTIILSEKEGKRHEINLFEDNTEFDEQEHIYKWTGFPTVLYSGSVSDFVLLPNKEEIAEKVCAKVRNKVYVFYPNKRIGCLSAIESLMSAIGEYKYIIITESEI